MLFTTAYSRSKLSCLVFKPFRNYNSKTNVAN